MSLLARLGGAALLLGCGLASGAAFADAAPADLAAASACGLDRVREIVAGAIQHGDDAAMTNRLIVENTADWVPAFNAFAATPEAGDLRAALDALGPRPSRAECRQFLSFAAVAASAEAVSKAGGALEGGAVLDACAEGLCAPPRSTELLRQCGFEPFSLPFRASC